MTKYDLPENFVFLVSLKALLRNKQGKYLMLKSANLKGVHQPHWGLPGGLLEKGEVLAEGLRREVFEETGLQIAIGRPLANSMFDRDFTFKDGRTVETTIVNLIYEGETEGDEVLLSDEHSDFQWMTPEEICQLDATQNVNLEKVIDYFRLQGYPKQ